MQSKARIFFISIIVWSSSWPHPSLGLTEQASWVNAGSLMRPSSKIELCWRTAPLRTRAYSRVLLQFQVYATGRPR
ncbi:uncharacterized protein B0H18DRAFT_34858 [Fomitopsis serialis]|uniref:uncharacterized protein n=1 Tax=Fomitopsis serialis TaxID=139415 RepID=UPI0020081E4B|nr:uncharacterized protein B0H18DRAFT_34858 [Neoantrodia serialis]KAH9917466.1 hypothetical protein B0H18DRAFT_34858 [Neoantrodia serialis]